MCLPERKAPDCVQIEQHSLSGEIPPSTAPPAWERLFDVGSPSENMILLSQVPLMGQEAAQAARSMLMELDACLGKTLTRSDCRYDARQQRIASVLYHHEVLAATGCVILSLQASCLLGGQDGSPGQQGADM